MCPGMRGGLCQEIQKTQNSLFGPLDRVLSSVVLSSSSTKTRQVTYV